MFKALRHPAIRRLWFGQALSSVGDEIYRVGFTWLAVGMIGADTGFLNASQAATLMILSFIGGRWADQWEPLTTMVRVDLIRALLVLVPVVVSFFMPVPLLVLWAMALGLAGLSAFFDPALQSCLPRFSPDLSVLRAATGLMSTTTRLARMVGPSLVGLLAGLIPIIHFFSLDSLSFLISALCVRSLRPERIPTVTPAVVARPSFAETLTSGFRAIQTQHGMLAILWIKGVTNGAWNLAQTLGLALLVHEVAPGDTRAFGLLIASYGTGNFLGALYFGNSARTRSELLMFVGYLWLGLGFLSIGLAPTLHGSMIAAALGGFGGPMNDLGFVDMVQRKFPIGEMTRIFRLRMAVETSMTLLAMIFAPLLFRLFHAGTVIAACGGVWIFCGALGLIWRPWVPRPRQ